MNKITNTALTIYCSIWPLIITISAQAHDFYLNSKEVGILSQNWDYEEFASNNQTLMNDNGAIYGLSYQGRQQWGVDYWSESFFQLGYGNNLQYNGSLHNYTNNQKTPYQMAAAFTLFDVGGKVGKSWQQTMLDTALVITPFVGLTREFIHNHDNPDSVYDYERVIIHYLLPVGIEFYQTINPRFSLRFRAQMDILLSGNVTSSMNLYGFQQQIINKQSNGDGHQFSFAAFYKTTEHQAIAINAYYRFLNVEDSNNDSITILDQTISLREPRNHTTATGLSVSILF